MKSRPDYHETTRASVSMNNEAGQKPQIVSKRNRCRDDLDPESSNGWYGYHTIANGTFLQSTKTQMQILYKCVTKNQKTSLPRETIVQNGLRYLTTGGQHPGGTTHGEKNQD